MKRLISIVLLALSFTGCAVLPGTGERVTLTAYDAEIYKSDVQALLKINRTVVQDEEVALYVNGLGEKLEQAHGKPCNCVVVVDSFSGYEAYTVSHSTIVLSTGVLAQASSDDEVAALIAHEMSHVYNRDSAKTLAQGVSITLGRMAGNLTGYGYLLTDFDGTLDKSAHQLIYGKWNAEHEIKADSFAVNVLSKAGFSQEGLRMALQKIGQYSQYLSAANKTNPEDEPQCYQKKGDMTYVNFIACGKNLIGGLPMTYLSADDRVSLTLEEAEKNDMDINEIYAPAGPLRHRFDVIQYLFAMNELVNPNIKQLRDALRKFERKSRPAGLQFDAAINSRLFVVYDLLGDAKKKQHYKQLVIQSDQLTLSAAKILYAHLDQQGDKAAIEKGIERVHQDLGPTDELLPVEYYLGRRHNLSLGPMLLSQSGCSLNQIKDPAITIRCKYAEDAAKTQVGLRGNWAPLYRSIK